MVVERAAAGLVVELSDPKSPSLTSSRKFEEACLIDCVSRACSAKMGTLKSAEVQGLPICDEMMGHPSIARYVEAGYTVLTF